MESTTTTTDQDISTAFLALYEETKRRFKKRGMHATIQTLERCQVILQTFLKENRPLKPYEITEKVVDNPAFARCKHGKSMVLYTLKKMVEAGIIEKGEYMGRKCYYHLLAEPDKDHARKVKETTAYDRAETTALMDGFRKLRELRSVMRLWRIPSLTLAIAHETIRLQDEAKNLTATYRSENKELMTSLQEHLEELKRLIEAEDEGYPTPYLDKLLRDTGKIIKELHFAKKGKIRPSLSLNTRRTLKLKEKRR